MGANRYISEPHESYSNTSTKAEAYPKDSERNTREMTYGFARSWIDKDYSNENFNPKVCFRSYGKVYPDHVRTTGLDSKRR
jgi:hypothetical protein